MARRLLAGSAVLVAGALVLSALRRRRERRRIRRRRRHDDVLAQLHHRRRQGVLGGHRRGLRGGQPRRHDRDAVRPERGDGRQAADGAELRRRTRHLHGARRRQARRRRVRRSGHGPDERDHRRHRVGSGRRAVRVRGRRQGLRRADGRAALRHLLLGRRVRGRGRHRAAGDDRRARDRRRGHRRRPGIAPDRRRREGRLAGRALVLQLRPARLRARRRWTKRPTSREFNDPCWLEAGENLQAFLDDGAVQRRVPHDRRSAGRRLVRGSGGQPPGGDGAHGRLGPGRDRIADPRREAAARPALVPVPRGRRAATASPAR